MADAIRVAIVDIYPLFREGVVQTFRRTKSIAVVAVGASAAEAKQFVSEFAVDILLIEAAVPDSLKAAQAIMQTCGGVKVVFMAARDDRDHATQAVFAGVQGYILKCVTGHELIQAIKTIHGGTRFISPDLVSSLLSIPANSPTEPQRKPIRVPSLTIREKQVLDHVSRGLTTMEIALKLGLSSSTIKNYRTLLFKKLGVRNRSEAIALLRSTLLGVALH